MSPALRGPSARPWIATRAGPSSGDKRAPATNPALMTAAVVRGSIVLSLTVIASGLILRGAIEASMAEITAEMRATTAEIKADMADTRAEIKADFAEIRAGFKADVAEIRAQTAKYEERWSALEQERAGRREVLEYMAQQQQLAEENQQ